MVVCQVLYIRPEATGVVVDVVERVSMSSSLSNLSAPFALPRSRALHMWAHHLFPPSIRSIVSTSPDLSASQYLCASILCQYTRIDPRVKRQALYLCRGKGRLEE